MGVTIKDVAKKCGMSITTVSLVLNNKNSRISEKTKQIIMETAQKLNYVPNRMAVGLATKKAFTIGLLTSETKGNYYLSLVQAAESACKNAGFFLMLYNISFQSEETLKDTIQFVVQNVDGVIFDPSFCSIEYSKKLLQLLINSNIPVITLSLVASQLIENSITIDRKQCSYIAASHLFKLNHKKVGCFFPEMSLNISAPLKEGYFDAADEFKITCIENMILESNDSLEEIENGFKYFIENKVTGIICLSSFTAATIYKLAHEKGISIPKDLSIISLEDSPFLQCFETPISALSLHTDRVVRKAVNLIRKIVKEEINMSFTPELIQPFFFDRKSTYKK